MIYLGIAHRRYMPLAVVTAIPLAGFLLSDLWTILNRLTIVKIAIASVSLIIIYFAITARIPSIEIPHHSLTQYCQFGSKSPYGFVDYFQKHPPQGLGYNFYDWGGFLIGTGFPAKLFSYGAMTVWEKDKVAPFGQSLALFEGHPLVFGKYNLSWILIPQSAPLFSKLLTDPENFGHWKIEYSDPFGVYLIKIP